MTDSHAGRCHAQLDELVKRVCDCREAFAGLFDHFYPVVFVFCLRRLVDRTLAEDITSEVFLKVARAVHQFSGKTTEDFRRWLFRIATNEINAQLRKQITRERLLAQAVRLGQIQPAAIQPIIDTPFSVKWAQVYELLSELDEREQTIISLRYFAGSSFEEIAAILDSTPDAIRKAHSRTLKRLRDRLLSNLENSHPQPKSAGGG